MRIVVSAKRERGPVEVFLSTASIPIRSSPGVRSHLSPATEYSEYYADSLRTSTQSAFLRVFLLFLLLLLLLLLLQSTRNMPSGAVRVRDTRQNESESENEKRANHGRFRILGDIKKKTETQLEPS